MGVVSLGFQMAFDRSHRSPDMESICPRIVPLLSTRLIAPEYDGAPVSTHWPTCRENCSMSPSCGGPCSRPLTAIGQGSRLGIYDVVVVRKWCVTSEFRRVTHLIVMFGARRDRILLSSSFKSVTKR